MPKPKFDKSKYSKAGKEQHPVKVVSTKRPVTKPPAKDKAVLNSVRCVRGLGRSRSSWAPLFRFTPSRVRSAATRAGETRQL